MFIALSNYSDASVTGVEVVTGSLTTHIIGSDPQVASKYSNKLNNNGVLLNPYIGFRTRLEDREFVKYWTVFSGQNSIGKFMLGGTYSTGKTYNLWKLRSELMFTAGAYWQDTDEFTKKGLDVISLGNIMPVLGMEANIYLLQTDDFYIKLNNLLSPVITTHNLSFGMPL